MLGEIAGPLHSMGFQLLATGGTAAASVNLIRRTGAEVVAACFVVELDFLGGRKRLHGVEIHSLVGVKE